VGRFHAQCAVAGPAHHRYGHDYLGVRPLLRHLSDGLQVFGAGVYPGYYHLFFRNGEPLSVGEAVVAPDFAAA
jgi:spermidine synthase